MPTWNWWYAGRCASFPRFCGRLPTRPEGLFASCRNPVRAAYVKANAAHGGITMAIELGHAIIAARRAGSSIVEAICRQTCGEIVAGGVVASKNVTYTSGAFDVGTIVLGQAASRCVLYVMNEYMAAEDDRGTRLATFPDVIATLDPAGEPVSVGDIRPGMLLSVLRIAKTHLPIALGLRDAALYDPVRAVLGIDVANYATSAGESAPSQ
ncbi:MAG: DUF917 family protein [Acetobacteraceae bacterium]